jgi:CRP-like cAMP-binding protein
MAIGYAYFSLQGLNCAVCKGNCLERTESSHPRRTKAKSLRAGIRADAAGEPVNNLLLHAVSDSEYGVIKPHLETLELRQHLILQEPGGKIDFAYFLNEGLASLVVLTTDGRSVEVAIVGKEGMIGTCLAAGLRRAPYRVIMQIAGSALRIASEALEQALSEAPELQRLLSRYVLVQGMQVAQIAACNRLHDIEQRLARWLLMCQDRVGSDRLPMTHEFLAQMLGTGRPSVSLAAGMLQRAGIIENLRGSVKILNRKELENSACECYRAIQHFTGTVVKRG